MQIVASIIALVCSAVSGGVPILDGQALQARVQGNNDTLYVVNFWATWCKPCVEELPYFEAERKRLNGRPVCFLLASLDFSTKAVLVEKFLKKNKYGSESFIIHTADQNKWISSIDSSWSGALPATVFYRNGQKVLFYEGSYDSIKIHNTLITLLSVP